MEDEHCSPNRMRLTTQEAEHFVPSQCPKDALARHYPVNDGHYTKNLDLTITPSLDSVSQLPLDLQQQILAYVDAGSLLSFRRVNKRAMSVVGSLRE